MGDVSYLYEPEGSELHWDGLKQAAAKSASNGASLSGPSPSYSSPMQRQGLAGTVPNPASYRPQAPTPPPHKMSPDDLMKQAQAMLDAQEVSNSHAMAQGPSVHDNAPGTPENGFNSQRRGGFEEWKAKNAPHDSGEDYDLQGAYAAGESPGKDGHWTDQFKKPNHETFSGESQYADYAPDKAGSWNGDQYQKPGAARPEWLDKYMGDN